MKYVVVIGLSVLGFAVTHTYGHALASLLLGAALGGLLVSVLAYDVGRVVGVLRTTTEAQKTWRLLKRLLDAGTPERAKALLDKLLDATSEGQ